MNRWLLCLVATLVLATGCRAKRIWTGIEFRPDGTIRLVAEEPMCGCLSVVNVSGDPVRVRASMRGETVGQVTLKAAERQRFRFDWAGNERDSFYDLQVFTPDGQQLDARKVLEFEDRPRWVECEAASCEFGELRMHAAIGEH